MKALGLALVILGIVGIIAGQVFDVKLVRLGEPHRIHYYNGTSWIDDVCHVDEDGVLWCTEIS